MGTKDIGLGTVRLAALIALLCVAFTGAAQHKPARIGVLHFTHVTDAVKTGVRNALREEGYIEGRNLLIEWRAAEGRNDRAKLHAQELVRLKVDVIMAMATPAVQAAKDATATIPIVMAPAGDPLRFVASLARPGGNITGVAGFGIDLSGKRIELLQELLPGIRRIGLLTYTADPFSKAFIAESRAAAAKASVALELVDVKAPGEIGAAYASMKKAGASAVIVQGVLTGPGFRAAELALQQRMPALSFFGPFAHQGGLVSYSGNVAETNRRAASYVKRILEGAKPSDLPVERVTRTELVINLKTAKALGLTVPPSLLARADQVIE